MNIKNDYFQQRIKKYEDEVKKQDEENEIKMQKFLENREQSLARVQAAQQCIFELGKMIEDSVQFLEGYAPNDKEFVDNVQNLKRILGRKITLQ